MSNEYTREWWRERLPLIQAFAEGKRVQINIGQSKAPRWVELCDSPGFEGAASDYRVAPEPKLRPWKPEEVPVGALVSFKHDDANLSRGFITHTNGLMVWTTYEILSAKEFSHLLENFVHSTDGGKTWHPCGVMEEQQ